MALKVDRYSGRRTLPARRAKGNRDVPVAGADGHFGRSLESQRRRQTLLGHVPPRADVTASIYDHHSYISETLEALALWERTIKRIMSR